MALSVVIHIRAMLDPPQLVSSGKCVLDQTLKAAPVVSPYQLRHLSPPRPSAIHAPGYALYSRSAERSKPKCPGLLPAHGTRRTLGYGTR